MDKNLLAKIWLLLFSLALVSAYSQNSYLKQNWVVQNPFEQKVFIENNEGQVNGRNGKDGDKILYSTRVQGVDVYFTATGLTYKYTECPKQNKEEPSRLLRNLEEPQTYFFHEKWEGANTNTQISPYDEVSSYYCYPVSNTHTTIAHAYQRIMYKDIYPGVDIEYSFPQDKEGIEYSIILHPGADLKQVKLLYDDASSISKDSDGNIVMQSAFGNFTDHAPNHTFYQEDNTKTTSTFVLSGKEASFNAGEYDHSKTLVIAPWITNPGITLYDKAYDLHYDLNGNAYVFGGIYPYEEVKISNTGAILWTHFTASGPLDIYGDLAVDEVNGTSYLVYTDVGLSPVPLIFKVNTLGVRLDSTATHQDSLSWVLRMKYNRCVNKLIISGECIGIGNNIATLDTAFTTIHYFNVFGPGSVSNLPLLALDNNSSSCYLASAIDKYYPTIYSNLLLKCPFSNLASYVFSGPDNYQFIDASTTHYVRSLWGYSGYNGITISPEYVCMYDGATLNLFSKVNGIPVASKTISHDTTYWGGIDVDLCSNMYLGNCDTIEIFDSALNKTGTMVMPSPNDTIYDVRVAPNTLFTCGSNFVASYAIVTNTLKVVITKSTPITSCLTCNATATAQVTACVNDSVFSFNWSDGETTQTATNLCAGTFTVTASFGCNFKSTDSVTIAPLTNGGMTLSSSETNVKCNGDKTGTGNVNVTGGNTPYTYYWEPWGETTPGIGGLAAGTYTAAVQDSSGCTTVTITITQPPANSLTTSPNVTIYKGDTTTLFAIDSGGTPPYKYTWSVPDSGTSVKVSPQGTTTYTVIVTDSNGCTETASITVTIAIREFHCGDVFIPDAFSPNGDGQNDVLYVRGDCIKTMYLIIMDRWGNKLFENEDVSRGWDGTYNGQPMNTGTYVYYLKVSQQDGTMLERRGNVELVR